MAGILKLIHIQDFVNTDTIEINHNSGYEYLKVKVIVDGESAESLIKSIITNKNNPTNILTVTLISSQTGAIQLFGSDVIDVGVSSATEFYIVSDIVEEYITTVSGFLQGNIDEKPTSLIELNDTPSVYGTGKYLQSTTTGSFWAAVAGIPGPKGSDGGEWLDGSGPPTTSTGILNNFYLDTDTGDIYKKETTAVTQYGVMLQREADQSYTFADAIRFVKSGVEVIIDNLDDTVSFTGNWYTYNTGNAWANSCRYATSASMGAQAVFDFTPPENGDYDVYAYWPVLSSAAQNAPFTITHASGISVVRKDQHTGTPQWNYLETHRFDGAPAWVLKMNIKGSSGVTTFSGLSDTPSTYNDGKYLKSTPVGTEWYDVLDDHYTESEVDTISGSLNSKISLHTSDTTNPHNVDETDVLPSQATHGSKFLSTNGTSTSWAAQSTGVTDHGLLTGLSDDDHAQYHNNSRGDARYYTQTQLNTGQLDSRYYSETEVDTLLSGKSDITHNHNGVYEPASGNIQSHISSTANPHSVTLDQAIVAGNTTTHGVVFNPISSTTVIDVSGSNLDLVWMLGHSTDGYGYYWKYEGTGTGDANYLYLYSENGTGADYWFYRCHQETQVMDIDVRLNVQSAHAIQFRDSDIYISSVDDGHLDLNADVRVDVHSNLYVSGNFLLDGGDTVNIIRDEDDFGHNDSNALVTQQSAKAYIDTADGALQTQIDGKDNYQSWSFAVNSVTQDEITSSDTLNFVGVGAVTVARSAEDEITISGSNTVDAVKAMMVYNTVVQTNVDTAESLRLEGTTRLDSGFSMGGTNSTEITINEAGWYEFQYSVAFDNDYTDRVIMRVCVERDGSGSWVEIDQSYSYEYLRYHTYGRLGNNTASFFLNASVGEKFRVRMDGATTGSFPSTSVDSDTIQNQCWVTVKSIDFDGLKGVDGADGVDGAQGPPGSGSTINVQKDGSAVSGSPFQTLNFKNFDDVSSMVLGTVDITPQVFGSEYDYTSVDSTTNTTSTSPINKLTLTTSSLPVGNYRVGWYYEWRRNTTSNDFRARVQIDNITTVMEHFEESKDVNSWHVESGFVQHTFTVASHVIDLDYWGESAHSTSYIRRTRIELWRVS